jgi:hypothetical protein
VPEGADIEVRIPMQDDPAPEPDEPAAAMGAEANARLIAAAPELLEALKDLLGDQPNVQNGQCVWCGREYRDPDPDFDIQTGDCPCDDCPSSIARSAIAKATAA